MTTMLEKMAKAIWAETAQGWDFHGNGDGSFELPEHELSVEDAWKAARAALLAIRESDDAILSAGLTIPRQAWEASIDAILNERP